nr:hypothetical protein DVH24_030744 [Ipomoea batatas]
MPCSDVHPAALSLVRLNGSSGSVWRFTQSSNHSSLSTPRSMMLCGMLQIRLPLKFKKCNEGRPVMPVDNASSVRLHFTRLRLTKERDKEDSTKLSEYGAFFSLDNQDLHCPAMTRCSKDFRLLKLVGSLLRFLQPLKLRNEAMGVTEIEDFQKP